MPYPVIYLGLSRLYPVGEAKYGALNRSSTKWDCEEDRQWFVENYRQILALQDDIVGVRALNITGVSRKRGSGVETSTYDEMANSAGQDNVGQILLAILSYKKLKRDMGADYPGGLLLIDELDATLHPFAQEQILRLLKRECKANCVQVVFTTHSMSLLELVCKEVQGNNPDYVCGTELYYFNKTDGKLGYSRNPPLRVIKSDLSLSLGSANSQRVGVFSEDAEARHLIAELLKGTCLENRLNLIESSFGCNTLMQLYKHDFPYMRDRILIFDGDVSEAVLDDKIPKILRDIGKNIVILLGEARPEQVIYDFLVGHENQDFWNAAFAKVGFPKDILTVRGPMSDEYSCESDERNRYKKWYRDSRVILELIGAFDAYKKEHVDEVSRFVQAVVDAHNAVAERTAILPI